MTLTRMFQVTDTSLILGTVGYKEVKGLRVQKINSVVCQNKGDEKTKVDGEMEFNTSGRLKIIELKYLHRCRLASSVF